jgi:hypothetical protein
MDEYRSTYPITWLNLFLTGSPMSIRKKGAQAFKVKNPLTVVLSNLRIDEQYAAIRLRKPALWDAFRSRFYVLDLEDKKGFQAFTKAIFPDIVPHNGVLDPAHPLLDDVALERLC